MDSAATGATPRGAPSGLVQLLRSYWLRRQPYQTFLFGSGVVLLLSGAIHAVVFATSGSAWDGPVSWRKPILFGLSFGVTCIALAAISTCLPTRRRLGWMLFGSFACASLAETALITMQRWRGVPSHFNFTGSFDGTVFAAMGGVVGIVSVDIVLVAVWCFRSLRTPSPSLDWAIRMGMLLLVLGQALGAAIIAVGVPRSVARQGSSNVFGPHGVLFGPAGVMKDSHAVALHAIEVIPLLAVLALFTTWGERRRRRAVIGVTVGYTGLLAVSLYQTFSGLATFALDLGALCVLIVSLAVIVGTYCAVVVSLLGGRPAVAAARHQGG